MENRHSLSPTLRLLPSPWAPRLASCAAGKTPPASRLTHATGISTLLFLCQKKILKIQPKNVISYSYKYIYYFYCLILPEQKQRWPATAREGSHCRALLWSTYLLNIIWWTTVHSYYMYKVSNYFPDLLKISYFFRRNIGKYCFLSPNIPFNTLLFSHDNWYVCILISITIPSI